MIFTLLLAGCAGKQPELPREVGQMQLEQARVEAVVESLRTEVQSLSSSLHKANIVDVPASATFCGIDVPLDRWWVRKKLEESIGFYTGFSSGRKRIELYLREAHYYFPFIEAKVREDGLPADLKYVPVIESEMNLQAESPQKAVGLWQIIVSTGRERGLRITHYIDERRDFERATEVALRKLKSDKEELGNWLLAIAAYNAGLGRLKKAVAEHADSSYFNMVLPTETMAYGYRLIALKLIMENPRRFGFDEHSEDLQRIDVVSYTVKKKTTLVALARELKVPAREFQLLNPQFVTPEIPRGVYRLKMLKEPASITAEPDSTLVAGDSLHPSSRSR
jgi:hypothetical protein